MKTRNFGLAALLFLSSTITCSVSQAQSLSDIAYPPTSSAGHDLNHSPAGESFKAVASHVNAGIYLASEDAFTSWLNTIYPGQFPVGSYPYAIAPSVTVTLSLYEGEGTSGNLLHSTTRTLSAPYSGYLDVDYAAAGITLVPGNIYTLLVVDNADPATYPSGVSGWVIPSVTDTVSGTGEPVYDENGNVVGYLPYGAYPDGHPILQGAVYLNDAGIGDNSFHVLDLGQSVGSCSGSRAVITSVGRDFIVVNGGVNASDHVFYTPTPAGTVFLGGTTMFLTGELVTYDGTLDSIGACHATTMTVEPAPVPELSCTKPASASAASGKGTITALGSNYMMLGSTRVDYASCTRIAFHGYATALAVGQKVEWKGYKSASVKMATSMKVD